MSSTPMKEEAGGPCNVRDSAEALENDHTVKIIRKLMKLEHYTLSEINTSMTVGTHIMFP